MNLSGASKYRLTFHSRPGRNLVSGRPVCCLVHGLVFALSAFVASLCFTQPGREKRKIRCTQQKRRRRRGEGRERAGKKTRAPIRARPLKNVCGRDLPWYLPLSRARDRSKKRRLSLRETENMISSWEGPQYVFYSLVLRLSFSRVFLFRRQRPGRPTPSPKGGRPSARPEF